MHCFFFGLETLMIAAFCVLNLLSFSPQPLLHVHKRPQHAVSVQRRPGHEVHA